MGLLELFITASMPVLNVLIVTGIGSFLATDYAGVLGEDARKHLNNVVFFVFNPALVFTNLARTITWESMVLLWFMPINVLLTFLFGSLLGWIVIQITKAPPNLRSLILGCCSAGNLGNLLIIIMPIICKEKGSPFGAPDVCHTYGLAYASLSMAVSAWFLRLKILPATKYNEFLHVLAFKSRLKRVMLTLNLKTEPGVTSERLCKHQIEQQAKDAALRFNQLLPRQVQFSRFNFKVQHPSKALLILSWPVQNCNYTFGVVAEKEISKPCLLIGAIFLWSYVYNIMRLSSTAIEDKTCAHGRTSTMKFLDESAELSEGYFPVETTSTKTSLIPVHFADDRVQSPSVSRGSSSNTKVPVSAKVRDFFSTLSGVIDLKKLFAPSTTGVILGFIVGVIPQIRNAIIGESAPLHVIQDSAALLSYGAIPCLTLIMGGNLMKGLHASSIQSSIIVGVTVVRYIMLPLLGVAVVKGAVHLGLLHSDPLYRFILLLQYALPPAMNINTMTQLFGAGKNECAVIFLWTYAIASLALTLWATFFMWLVS